MIDTYICEEYQNLCEAAEKEYGISAELLEALIETESSGQSDVVGGTCIGLCQLNSCYFSGDLYDPETNIRLASEYLISLTEEYVDMAAVLMRYHGEKNVKERARTGKISRYARTILKRKSELEYIHDNSNSDNGSSDDSNNSIIFSSGEGEVQKGYVEADSYVVQGWIEEWSYLWHHRMPCESAIENGSYWETVCACPKGAGR